MADSAAFVCVTEALRQATSFDALASNGTIRIALKKSGLDPRTVSAQQMTAVVKQILPKELAARGVLSPEAVCTTVAGALGRLASGPEVESADAVFRRLGR